MIFHTNFSKFLKKSKMIDSNFRISSFQKIDLRIYPNNFSFHLYRRDSLGPSILYKNADPSLNNIYDTVRSNIIQNGCYDPSVGCFCLFHRVLCVAVGDWYRRLKNFSPKQGAHNFLEGGALFSGIKSYSVQWYQLAQLEFHMALFLKIQ